MSFNLPMLSIRQLLFTTNRQIRDGLRPLVSLAANAGLVHPSYQRYILLSGGRSGSTMIVECLNQTPAIVMKFESFHLNAEPAGSRRYLTWKNEPIKYLNRNVYEYYSHNIKAVGFSIHYYHCQEGGQRAVWD